MLSEVNQTEQILYNIIYIWNLKRYNKLVNKRKEADSTDREHRENSIDSQWEKEKG